MNEKPYKGVYYNKSTGRWVASIKIKGKQKHLGSFKYFEDALVARKDAEKEVNANG